MGPDASVTSLTATQAVNSSPSRYLQYCLSWCQPTLPVTPPSEPAGGL